MAEAGIGLLDSISEFCRRAGMAESTFGRRAVNDGKFVSRLRDGARITPETLERVSDFLTSQGVEAPASPPRADAAAARRRPPARSTGRASGEGAPSRNFRFFDNRQKYLLFVNTCSEKETIARRVGMELAHLHPEPPAVRVFDAGMGDGTVLTRVMREMHRRFPTLPFYVVGKEISLEDVRLSPRQDGRPLLRASGDRAGRHQHVLHRGAVADAEGALRRHLAGVARGGADRRHGGRVQRADRPRWSRSWPRTGRRGISAKTGNPVYERPVALVIYRDDFRFLLDDVIPRQGRARADYDLVIASQPYRARVPVEFKAAKVIAPLTRALRPGGRLLGIHSCGRDPGLEIVRKVWPDEDPFKTSRHDILRAVRAELGRDARHYNFNAYADQRAVFRYDMHTLPTEIADSHRHLDAVRGLERRRLRGADRRRAPGRGGSARAAISTPRARCCRRTGSLWFLDESYVISRKRG